MSSKPHPTIRARRALAFFLLLTLTALPILPTTRAMQATSSSRAAQQPGAGTDGGKAAKARAQDSLAKLDLSFEANQGQANEQVRFLARGAGYTLFLMADEAVFVLRDS